LLKIKNKITRRLSRATPSLASRLQIVGGFGLSKTSRRRLQAGSKSAAWVSGFFMVVVVFFLQKMLYLYN
jgi:uncharacterized membrane protein SirB2